MQNLVSMNLTSDQLTAVDSALESLETSLAAMVSLSPAQRRSVPRMGDKSEAFCRQTLLLLGQNPQVVTPNLGLPDAESDLATLDALRPRLLRLARLTARGSDTEMALGSDVMAAALEGYALLKVSGRNQSLEGLRASLGSRFAKRSRTTPEAKAA
jgi:hypothetical protein